MRLLIIIAIALALGAAVIWAAKFEAGFVLLQYGNWSLETSLIVFSVALLMVVAALYMLLRSLVVVKKSPAKLSDWKARQKHRKASRALTRGLITLEEGRWAEAERILVRHAGNSETPLLHYLAAARSAQKQGASDRRDNYLRLAHETTEGADIAVGVVQAELQLSAGQNEQALATLQHLREMAPKHPYVLQLLQKLYQDLEQWQDVQTVLPDLRKRHVLQAGEVKALDNDATVGQLETAMNKQDWTLFSQIWQQSPAKMRQSETLLKPYLRGLLAQGENQTAMELIEQFMRKSWSDELVYLYGQIAGGDLLKRLATAEKWLKDKQQDPWLLLTLGKLATEAELWTKAEEYLSASLEYGPRGETYQILAQVQRTQGRTDAAAATSAEGLDFMLNAVKI